MMTKSKKKLRMEEEMDILEAEDEKLSKQELRKAIKAKENLWGIFPSATTERTVLDLGQFTEKTGY